MFDDLGPVTYVPSRHEWHEDPHPDALSRHGGPQCESRDGVWRCTLRAGHGGTTHQTWSHRRGQVNHSWAQEPTDA